MSEQAIDAWLASHDGLVPALEMHQQQAMAAFQRRDVAISDLAEIFARDPGLSISLFRLVNAGLKQTGDDGANSIQAALNRADTSALADLVRRQPVLEQTRSDESQCRSYYQLLSRTYHLQAQLEGFTHFQPIGTAREMICAGLLHNLGEYLTCLFDYKQYQKYEIQHRIMGADAGSGRAIFDFDFRELGRQYAQRMHLPNLVIESLQDDDPDGSIPRWIRLADDFTRQAEDGWYHPGLQAACDTCAAYFEQTPDNMARHLQQVALSAARSCPLADSMPAAARLIMYTASEAPVSTTNEKPALKQRINRLLNSAGASDVDFIDLMLTFVDEDLDMSRTALLLLSPDKQDLSVRATRGIDAASPINTMLIETRQAGLLKQMLVKPQGLWMQPQNHARFKSGLPADFNRSFDHDNYFLMSFFINGNPTGIVYCDRCQAGSPPDLDSYRKFKSAVQSIGIAMTRLSERRRRQAV
jgi:hypothetical protein